MLADELSILMLSFPVRRSLLGVLNVAGFWLCFFFSPQLLDSMRYVNRSVMVLIPSENIKQSVFCARSCSGRQLFCGGYFTITCQISKCTSPISRNLRSRSVYIDLHINSFCPGSLRLDARISSVSSRVLNSAIYEIYISNGSDLFSQKSHDRKVASMTFFLGPWSLVWHR